MNVKLTAERRVEPLTPVLADTLDEMFAADQRLVYMDCALARASGVTKLFGKYGDRVVDCGIQEQNMLGAAAGMSIAGKVPFVHTFSIFIARRACDQLFLSGSYNKANVKVLASDPGISATTNGGTHMPFEDVSIVRAFPEMTLMDCTDAVMLKSLLHTMADTYGMMYLRFPRKTSVRIYEDGTDFIIGKANLLREGTDATIIACGMEVSEALKAAEQLAGENISVRVIDMFTIKPLDVEMVLDSAVKTGAIVTAENASYLGGLGSAVAEVLSENCPTPMERIGVKDRFGEVGNLEYLRQRFELTADDIAAACRRVIARKNR